MTKIYNDKLTLEKIEQRLKELFETHPIPRFHPSVEKELNDYFKEHGLGQCLEHGNNLVEK